MDLGLSELKASNLTASVAADLAGIVKVALEAGWTGEGSEELAEWLRERMIAAAALARTRAVDGTSKDDPELVWAPSAEDLTRAATTGGDLLPCPFCGSWPLTTREVNQRNGNVAIRISCPGKGLVPCSFMVTCVRADGEAAGRADLYARWNARPSLPGGKGLAPNAAQLATACNSMAAAIRRTGGVTPAIAGEFEALMRAFDALDEEDSGVSAQPAAPWSDQEREAMAGGEPPNDEREEDR